MRTFAAALLAATVVATDHGPTYGGSGPFKSYSFEVEALPNHTFYQPLESGVGSDLKLPVIVWGNGFLGEVASHANASGSLPGENPPAMTAAIDWVQANAGKGEWSHIDASRIGTWGQSCGGLEAYAAGLNDSRVNHLGIFNSGQLTEQASQEVASNISKPVFYLLGGPSDVAYPNGERDYADLPATTPSWKGNHALGHSAAFDVPDGGIPGIVGSQIMQWILRGNQSAKAWFTDGSPKAIGVNDVAFRNLDLIEVIPI
ncbi:hypothetical protein F5883DRAFT_609008 [Diaporthe sp. PMI_573]|nr:hypothetical protein F5883DRAFT_609008 [Diaporthaceae sp. PMI_573]